jgi:hypothetical protein
MRTRRTQHVEKIVIVIAKNPHVSQYVIQAFVDVNASTKPLPVKSPHLEIE